MTSMARAKPRRGAAVLSRRAPTIGPPTAADAVREATTYDPVVALPITAIVTMRRAGPADSVPERASVAVVRYGRSVELGGLVTP
jgi:hypothetical protein